MRLRAMLAGGTLGMMIGAGGMLQAQGTPQAQGTLQAQGPQTQEREGRAVFAGMQRVAGEVTAVSGATVTVKTEDGATMQIVTTDNTRGIEGSRRDGEDCGPEGG